MSQPEPVYRIWPDEETGLACVTTEQEPSEIEFKATPQECIDWICARRGLMRAEDYERYAPF